MSPCKTYRKPPTRPLVGLPLSNTFLETVAMDLKHYKVKILLHIVDHCTRLSASTVIPNKQSETIIKYIFKIWIPVFESPAKFLTDNGGEFANSTFTSMCESLGIVIKTTAAESSWSNSLVERHHLIIADMLDKVLEETQCDLELAVTWCINAKNCLSNIHGFSPYQLFIGTNPKLPSMISNRAPALTAKPSSKVISNNLKAKHKAREAFIASENSEKIRRALAQNIRTSGGAKYITGDHVYFKRAGSREWHGPATVLDQDGQQVLVKNGSSYVRVQPCQLQSIPSSPRPTPETETTTIEAPNPQNTKLTHCPTSIRP